MNTLFNLDELETKTEAEARKPAAKQARYWIEIERDGNRAAFMGSHGDELRYMFIRAHQKQPAPHLYKTFNGAHKANKEIEGTVKVWTGSYAE